jgi:hypothetical protein
MRCVKMTEIGKLTHPLCVTIRLNLRTLSALRNVCCDFTWQLGGIGDLLLTALGVLGRIFPRCTNLSIHR